jgi:hypothetical protein
MRYRITIEQVMTTWYATVSTWEPDGLALEKHTRHFSFPVKVDNPTDLALVLSSLEVELFASAP